MPQLVGKTRRALENWLEQNAEFLGREENRGLTNPDVVKLATHAIPALSGMTVQNLKSAADAVEVILPNSHKARGITRGAPKSTAGALARVVKNQKILARALWKIVRDANAGDNFPELAALVESLPLFDKDENNNGAT